MRNQTLKVLLLDTKVSNDSPQQLTRDFIASKSVLFECRIQKQMNIIRKRVYVFKNQQTCTFDSHNYIRGGLNFDLDYTDITSSNNTRWTP